MEQTLNMPTKPGQICRLVNVYSDEDPEEVYIVSEDPGAFDPEDIIYITPLKALQRHLHAPALTPQEGVRKQELIVVADSLEAYIAGLGN